MTVLARELQIQYGSYVVGGAQTGRILERWYTDESEYEKGILEFKYLIRASTEALFNTAIAAAETAFVNPNQAVTITQGSETLKSWSHSSNTGFNARPRIMKREDVGDTGRSRRYFIRIECDLPASPSSTSGRRVTRGSVNVAYSPSRCRTVTITPQYTALSSNAARAQYEAAIGAYATSVLNALGGTYKIREEPNTAADDQDKLIDIARVYEEIVMTGVGSGDASVRGEELKISRDEIGSGDTRVNGKAVERLVTLTANYTAWIDKESSTDLDGKWDSLRSGVISKINGLFSGGSTAIIQETPNFDLDQNAVRVTIVAQGSTHQGVVEYRESATEPKIFGKQGVGVWDGNPWSKHVFPGPGSWQRRVTQTYVTLGEHPAFTPSNLAPPAGMKKFEVSDEPTVTPITRGINGATMDLIEVSRTATIEFYTDPGSGGGGGGSTVAAETTGDPFIDAIIAGAAPGQVGAGAGTSARFNVPR